MGGDVSIPEKKHQENDWRAAWACVQGLGHVKHEIPCQDAVARVSDERGLAMCVCDGAGSERLSHFGAQAVAVATVDVLLERGACITGEEVLETALEAVQEVLKAHGGRPRDYACTLVALAVVADQYIMVHIGDGIIAAIDGAGPVVVSRPDNGEFANLTVFVTSPDAKDRVRIQVRDLPESLTGFALMSDGADTVLYDYQTGLVSAAVQRIAGWLDHATEEVVGQRIEEVIVSHFLPATQDDCSLVVMSRRRTERLPLCRSCGSASFRRGKGGKRSFRIICSTCDHAQVHRGSTHREYPVEAQEWVTSLRERSGLSVRQVSEITRISMRTIARWMRARRDLCSQ